MTTIPKHWLAALDNDTQYQQAKLAADNAYTQYCDIRDYADNETKRIMRINTEHGLSVIYTLFPMFGTFYTDPEIGAYIYAAKYEYERLQKILMDEYQRVVKNC